MQIVEELEGPLTPEERAGMIINLLEMIDHWNAGIERHLSYDEPDQFTLLNLQTDVIVILHNWPFYYRNMALLCNCPLLVSQDASRQLNETYPI